MPRQRARQIHEKEGRRQAILRAASEAFEGCDFSNLTMAQIAKRANLGKGTIYIYYNTKEEIFLHLTEAQLLGFFETLDEGLRASRGPLDPDSLTSLVLGAVDSQPQLPKLLSILHTVIEQNVDRLTALKFREFLATRITRSGRHLEHHLSFLAKGEGIELAFQIHCLLLGTWPVSDPSPVVRELLGAPGLHIFYTPFRERFTCSLRALTSGLQYQRERKKLDGTSRVAFE